MNSRNWIELDSIESVEPYEAHPIWQSTDAITLGELREFGFYDPSAPEWKFECPTDAIYEKICSMLYGRYQFRDISITPAAQWKIAYLQKFAEIMPKYAPVFEIASDIDPLQSERRYGRSRQVYSDFPQSRLAGNEDYASNGNDREYEDVVQGSLVSMMDDYMQNYSDVFAMILDECEDLFSPFISVNLNGW